MHPAINLMLPHGSRRRALARYVYTTFSIFTGKNASSNQDPHTALSSEALGELEASLRMNYFNRQLPAYLETAEGLADLKNHLTTRLHLARVQVVPWIESVKPLQRARVLEIGCGTGSSVVALAERGAHLIGIDIDEGALQVARKRCSLHGVSAEFHLANASEIAKLFSDPKFDVIIFYAALEHMLHEERLRSIADTWAMLRPDDLWCVVETPNRLWHTDSHTARLPFFHWLPDELAFKYARFSERTNFREIYNEWNEERQLHFRRRGRGVSFHEWQIALGSKSAFEVVSYKNEFLTRLGWLSNEAQSDAYVALLSDLDRDVHPAFLQEYLDIILRKPKQSADHNSH